MPGNRSRGKGARREYEAARLLPGGVKVSRMYKEGPDIHWRDLDVEVKARADGWKELHKWLANAGMLMLKADRKPWLIVFEYDTFLDVLEGYESSGQEEGEGT